MKASSQIFKFSYNLQASSIILEFVTCKLSKTGLLYQKAINEQPKSSRSGFFFPQVNPIFFLLYLCFLGIGTSSGVAAGRVWHCSAKARSSVRLRRCSRLPWRCSANSKGQSTHHHMELQRANVAL